MDTTIELTQKLHQLARDVAEIKAAVVKPPPGQEVATLAELDDQYGDPLVKYDIRGWQGPSMVGKNFSHLTPEELLAVAADRERYAKWADDSGAVDGKGRPKSKYARKDAALARGWAKRIASAPKGAEEIPF